MKIFKIIIVSFMFANIASSNVTDEIIQKLNETNNIVFNFDQLLFTHNIFINFVINLYL